jgi:hypothetical protein
LLPKPRVPGSLAPSGASARLSETGGVSPPNDAPHPAHSVHYLRPISHLMDTLPGAHLRHGHIMCQADVLWEAVQTTRLRSIAKRRALLKARTKWERWHRPVDSQMTNRSRRGRRAGIAPGRIPFSTEVKCAHLARNQIDQHQRRLADSRAHRVISNPPLQHLPRDVNCIHSGGASIFMCSRALTAAARAS